MCAIRREKFAKTTTNPDNCSFEKSNFPTMKNDETIAKRQHNKKNTKRPREQKKPSIFSSVKICRTYFLRKQSASRLSGDVPQFFPLPYTAMCIFLFHFTLYFCEGQQPFLFRVLNPRLIAVSAPERKAVWDQSGTVFVCARRENYPVWVFRIFA